MQQWIDTKLNGVKSYYIRPRQVALLYAFIAFMVLLATWLYVGGLVEDRLSHAERDQIATQVNTVGTSLTLAVNQRLNLIMSARSFMEAEIDRNNKFSFTDLEEVSEVDKFISGLYDSVAGIRNIAIAPGGVMEYVYPYDENKSVLGYEPALDERSYVQEDVPPVLEDAGVLPAPSELNLALKNQSDQLFFGSENVFLSSPVTYTIILLEGHDNLDLY
jgi:sensor domain CHASE-containing protein